MKRISESEMLHRTAAYCSIAERCIQDIEKKIKTAGLSQEECNRIVTRLLKERFIDEQRFACYFVNDKLRFNKWGRTKINYELQKKGIPSSIRQKALETIDNKEYEVLLYSLLKAKKSITKGKDERDIYLKLVRFASSRGFEGKFITLCLRKLFNGGEYEESFE